MPETICSPIGSILFERFYLMMGTLLPYGRYTAEIPDLCRWLAFMQQSEQHLNAYASYSSSLL